MNSDINLRQTESKDTRSAALGFIAEFIPSRALRYTIYAIFWGIVALASATHWWFYPQGNYPYTWWELVAAKSLVWGVWALFTPMILWLGAKFRLDVAHRTRNLLALLVMSVASTLCYLVIYTALILFVIDEPEAPSQFSGMFRFMISMHSTYYLLAFWAMIGVEHLAAYYRRYLERERLAAQLQAQLAKAQLERLKSQLHPHFLFNTLNTVSSLVLSDKSNEAYDALVDLAELLRMSLDRHDQEFSSLAEEIEFNQLYLKLMARRFPEQLRIKWAIAPEALDAQVPNMILQPLIENAVKYSVDQKSQSSMVTILAEIDARKLLVAVTNSRPESSSTIANGFGIGLSQVEQRLMHHYPDHYEFSTDSSDKSHFRVELAIPYSSQPQDKLNGVEAKKEIHSDNR